MMHLSLISESDRNDLIQTESRLVCVMDDNPTVRRIIEFGASRKRHLAVECQSLDELLLRVSAHTPSHLFIDVECAGSDAVEVMRRLEGAGYKGAVHLMSAGPAALLQNLTEIGAARGLAMGQPLQKPFRRAAIELLLEEPGGIIALEDFGTTAPPLAAADRGTLLRDAVTSGAVDIVYQPRFDLETGRPYGAEVRTRHAGLNAPLSCQSEGVAPEDLDRLSEIMLVSALSAWRRFARPSFQPAIKLRIPVSSLARLPLGDIIRRNRPEFQDWPGIVIELTETNLARDPWPIREIAAQLQIYGLGISFGDLGTGRTVLRVLESVSPQELSLSRVFVAGCAHREFSRKLCKSMILFAESLGARSVAEGLQSKEDVAAMVELGCAIGQGDALSQALSADDFERFIARGGSVSVPERSPSRLLHLREYDSRLSLREIEVLELIAMGKSSKEAGQMLGLSPRTIDVYRAKLMAKLNARNVAELVKVALTARH